MSCIRGIVGAVVVTFLVLAQSSSAYGHVEVAAPDDQSRVVTSAEAHRYVRTAYRADTLTVAGLSGLAVGFLFSSALGIVGYLSYRVIVNRRELAIRRALGARRGDIVRHLLFEAAVVAGAGLATGIFLSIAVSDWLANHHSIAQLTPRYLVLSALLLCVVVLIVGFVYARRARRIPPAG
jgi:putative ABC transport system permease protein